MKKLFTILTLCLLAVAAFAENKQISGVVVDEKGEPVIGASIQVNGTSIGTISDYDGKFELSVPTSAKTLTVSYVGMQPMEVAITANMRIVLKENSEVIQEIVVTGYGNVSKGSFAGSAQAVKAETIEKKNPTEVSKALAGEVAGVQVINGSGQPGTNATIRIRGIGSINASSAPLYIVDGVTYDGDISAIDPGDIASTTILKDATATSLYGSRGANGVIVITTKKGTKGDEGKIDVAVKYGGNMRLLPLYETITDPEQYVALSWLSLYNAARLVDKMSEANAIKAANTQLFSSSGIAPDYNMWDTDGKYLINPYDAQGNIAPSFAQEANRLPGYQNLTSWQDALFRTGQKVEANVKIHGGSDKTNYYTSFGYLKDEGYYIGSDFSRFTVRSNIEHQAKKWLKGNLNIAYSYTNFNAPGQDGDGAMNNGFYYINAVPPVYTVFEHDRNNGGQIIMDPRTGTAAYDYGENTNRSFGWGINPAGALLYDKENQKQHTLNANAGLDFKLYKGLTFQLTVGAHYYNNTYADLTNKWYGDAAGLGRIRKQSTNFLSIEAKQMLEYNTTIGAHSIRVLAGHETDYLTSSYVYGYKSHLVSGESLELGNAIKMESTTGNTSGYTLDSYLASVSYIYDERYMVTANYRADGSSKFAKGHRWGHFGSIGFAWDFTNETFLRDNEWLKNGKLRLSWGVLGNQGVSSYYLYTDRYSIDNVNGVPGVLWASKGNADLTWERNNTTDLGLEFSIGKYLDTEIDYFYKLTDNMIFPRAVAPSMGYTSVPTNDAKMVNQGVELTFNIHAVDTRNVKLDIRLNGAHYKNMMKQMPIDYYDENGEAHRMIMNGAMAEGHSLYDHYTAVYAGVDDKGNALYEAWYDADKGSLGDDLGNNEYNIITSLYLYQQENPDAHLEKTTTKEPDYATAQYVGKSYLPDFGGGLGLDLEVYGVTISAALSYQIGGYGYDATYMALMDNDQVGKHNWHVDMLNSWTETNNTSNIPRLSNGRGTYDSYANMASTRFLTSNSFLSLNNVQIGYNFPKKWIEKIKLNKLNVYVSADNLCIATARKGYNPMTSFTGTSDTHGYSPLSTIIGGIKFTF